MNGKEAVTKAREYLDQGHGVKLWAKDEEGDGLRVYPWDMFEQLLDGKEIGRGMKNARDYMENRFATRTEVFILSFEITPAHTGGQMPSATTTKPKAKAPAAATKTATKPTTAGGAEKSKEPTGTNPLTGERFSSIGNAVGLAVLAVKDPEAQLKAATKAFSEAFAKKKGKAPAAEEAEKRARSWVTFLRKKHPSLYPAVAESSKN